ncbi:hypothetical protein Nepgr_002564 [Nepenthes gracilis]|uniref:Uncharacterized protein n=1 Tax=Nepenthes gracilis TaxID=150966 RepID=A0AAD3RYI7_NEPGR|nr:hypothetical protein Nepgr_002564 [Nepenthes gracilis]
MRRVENESGELRESGGVGSNGIASLDVEAVAPPSSATAVTKPKDFTYGQDHRYEEPGWRKFFKFVGPGFLVSLAYIDPGNLLTDLQAGAGLKYELLWVILVGLIAALVIQSFAANLGVSTGKHLAELCKAEYPVVVAYFIGTAAALNILFKIPMWTGVLIAGLNTLLLIGLQRYGMRKLEVLIAIMIFVMAGCFFAEMSYVKLNAKRVVEGMFIPKLSGPGATADSIALLGTTIMPHNLFLHSALVLTRKVPKSVRGINEACRFFLLESGFALFVALLINIAVVSVTGAICWSNQITPQNADTCNNITLNSAYILLQNVLGSKTGPILYAVALLASGQSSAVTGTYAGQFIMLGFLNLKMKKWSRNLLTRTIALTPSLIVSIISGPKGASRLIIISSMIVIAWTLGLGIIIINIYYLSTTFVGWLIHNSLPRAANVIIGILVFPLMAIYVLGIIYLAFRKNRVETFIEPDAENGTTANKADGEHSANFDPPLPYRDDLAEIPE